MQLLAPLPIATKVPVVINGKAGGARQTQENLTAAFEAAGVDAEIIPCDGDACLAARRALAARPSILVAAGGDGTVSALAGVVKGTGTALGVMPIGTLNHFARDLGLPLDLTAAARVIAAGRRVAVDVGEVNGRVFINNASLGLYADMVRRRKRHQRRLGRSKRSAMLWATLEVLRRSAVLQLRLDLGHRLQDCRSPFVFIGNNDYVLEGFNIGIRERLDAGLLNVYTTRRSTALGLIGLLLRAMFGRLRQADDFMEESARSLRVESRHSRLLVATDGEVNEMDTPLEFRIRPRALNVIVP
ncbi:MAG TPA: diacylglycerol kinase family protein [Burkholderiales bacterium]|nr:diacylglycerol kinase family protein [Burkholderiales bacterium]